MAVAVIIAVLVLAAAFFVICFACYRKAFYLSKNTNKDPHIMLEGEQYEALKNEILPMVDSALKIPYKEVQTVSFDGLKLYGKYYEAKKGAPLEIMFHGYKSIALRDFCGAMQTTLAAGRNVLLIDERAHGKSEGRCLAFGVLERFDCLSWIDFAIKTFGKDTKIILVGVSMGAATVLMASNLELPENVVGIVADSGYTSPKEIIKKVIGEMGLPVKISYFFAFMGAEIFGKFNLHESDAITSVKESKVPILFFHGEDDRFVPCEMVHRLYDAANCPKNILTVKGAGHGLEYMLEKDNYLAELKKFYETIL